MKIHRYAVGLLVCLALQTQGVFGDTQAFVKTDSLHVRSKPAAEAESIGGLKKNDRVLVEKNLGEWLQISFEGRKGYIASRMTDLSTIEAIGRTTPLKAIKVGDPAITIASQEQLTYYEKTNGYALISKNNRLYYVHTSLLNLPEEKSVEAKQPSSLPAKADAAVVEKTAAAEEQALFALAELEIVTSPVFEEAEASLFALPTPEKDTRATSFSGSHTAEKANPAPADAKAAEKANSSAADAKAAEKTTLPPAKVVVVSQENIAAKEPAKPGLGSKTETPNKINEDPSDTSVVPVTRSFRIPGNGPSADLSDPLLQRFFSLLGSPYVYGARGPEAFDCSGLTYYVFEQEGYKLPRTSEDQSRGGFPVNFEDLRPGDLLFFDTRSSIHPEDITDSADPISAPVLQPSKVTHVGVYIGEGKMIHASSSQRKVIIAEASTGYFAQRLVTVRRY